MKNTISVWSNFEMHQYHISNAIFLLNGFPKKRDVYKDYVPRVSWCSSESHSVTRASLSSCPPQPLFVNPAPPWPCPHACPPRQVHIRISSYQCGGVLLNHWYIATAAHCVHRAKLSKITVRSQIDFFAKLILLVVPGAPWWIWHEGWGRGAVGQPDLQSRPHCHSSWF